MTPVLEYYENKSVVRGIHANVIDDDEIWQRVQAVLLRNVLFLNIFLPFFGVGFLTIFILLSFLGYRRSGMESSKRSRRIGVVGVH